jgi:hypothetical protein
MNKDKMKQLLEMQEYPERYTEEEIRRLMTDEECRLMYEQMIRATDAMFFEEKKQVKTGKWKIAAAFIGFLMLSGIAYATISHFIATDEKPKTAITERKLDVKRVKGTAGIEMTPTENAPVVFNNVELQQIMQYVAEGYNVKVEFRNKAACTIRFYLQWEADDTLQEIIEKINHFEKVHLTFNEETIIIQ